MNIDNLSVGLIVKSYRAMCKLLDEQIVDGNSKQAQLKEWARYFKWKNEKYKFIIEEIYAEPLPKEDGRVNNGGNNTKYDELMDKLIINLLIDYDGLIEESYSSLMNNYFNFFTDEYKKLYRMGYKRYSQVNQMGKGLVREYQMKMKVVVEKCLITSLKRLQRKGIIEYEQRTIVLDNNFKKTYADKKMLKKIKDYESKAYDEMGKTPFDRGTPSINRQFKNIVCGYLDVLNYWNVFYFELVDKTTERVEEDSEELIRRFIKSTEQNTKNTNIKGDGGDKYKPYSYNKYEGSIDKLTKLIWKLPEGYTSKYDVKQLLIGEVDDVEGRYEEYEQTNYEVPF